VQGLSGTGSLRLGAAFIQRYFPGTTVYISSPTWGKYQWHAIHAKLTSLHVDMCPDALIFAGNHKNIFNDAGVPWKEYRYFNPKTVGLDFDGMMEDIEVNFMKD